MDLGTIQSMALKDIWAGEATHFTPWLADNLGVLSAKLGMDLAQTATEAPAGDFFVDILAQDLSTGRHVIIENQYGSTDHRHFGQLITYAATLKAGVVVWIAEKIRPEHKFAIDFLNQNLRESLVLYGVEASAIRIDNSKPAFILTVVCMPTESPVIDDGIQPASEIGERYRSYFQTLIDTLREKHKFTNARSGQPQNWYSFSSERSKVFVYSTSFSRGGKVRVEIYLDCRDKQKNEQLFDCLLAQKEQIESAVGHSLEWERLDERRACRIAVYRDGEIDADTTTLVEISEWAIQCLLKFKQVFPTYISACLHDA